MAPDLPAPVVHRPEAGERALQLDDARLGELSGVSPGLYGSVLRREPERVEAERGEHRLAQHRLVADDEVTEGVVAHVALMGRTRGVRVHAERVERRPRVVVVDLVGLLVAPALLPFALDGLDVVFACHPPILRVGCTGPGPAASSQGVFSGVGTACAIPAGERPLRVAG